MKGNKLYFSLLAVFLVLVFLYQYFSPKQFTWKPTFYHADREPFGCYVFDDVVSSSVPSYEVQRQTLYQLYMKSMGLEPVENDENEDTEALSSYDEDEEDYYDEDESYSDDSLRACIAAYHDSIISEDSLLWCISEYWGSLSEELRDSVRDSITARGMYVEESSDDEDEEDAESDLPEASLLPQSERRAILVVEESLSFSSVDLKALLGLLKQGNKVMLCTSWLGSVIHDSLWISTGYIPYYSGIDDMKKYVKEGNSRDSIFLGTDVQNAEQIFAVYPYLYPEYLKEGLDTTGFFEYNKEKMQEAMKLYDTKRMRCDSLEVLACNRDNQPLALRAHYGEGELYIVSTPLMFSNYGLLDRGNASYAFRLLSYMKDLPIVRLESYGVGAQETATPFRYLLSQPPLRWALYVSLLTILLFMIFTAKRRQRMIPVVAPPANETIRFTRLIGNLFYQKKNYSDLLAKKYLYFYTEVKRLYGLDLQSDETEEELCGRLAEKMGETPEMIRPSFHELQFLLHEDAAVDEEAAIRCIKHMNEWKEKLN